MTTYAKYRTKGDKDTCLFYFVFTGQCVENHVPLAESPAPNVEICYFSTGTSLDCQRRGEVIPECKYSWQVHRGKNPISVRLVDADLSIDDNFQFLPFSVAIFDSETNVVPTPRLWIVFRAKGKHSEISITNILHFGDQVDNQTTT